RNVTGVQTCALPIFLIETDLCLSGMGSLYPVDCSFYLSSGKSGAALGLRIISAVYHRHIAVFICLIAFASDKICIHQTHFIAREDRKSVVEGNSGEL